MSGSNHICHSVYPFYVSLGALYRPLILHQLLSSVHCIVVRTFKIITILKLFLPWK